MIKGRVVLVSAILMSLGDGVPLVIVTSVTFEKVRLFNADRNAPAETSARPAVTRQVTMSAKRAG